MVDKNTGTALATVEPTSQFMALAQDTTELQETMDEVFGTEGLSFTDLERIRLPGAGGKSWTLKNIDGDEKDERTFEAIILTHRQVRTYWQGSFDENGGGKPPDCFSDDAVKGIGTPGIECATCPHAQFKSAGKGSGQACQLKRLVFFLLPDQIFPAYVALPPTSQNEGKSYLLGLLSRNLKPYDVVTEFSLEVTKNDSGIAYSKVKMKRARSLTDEEKVKVRAISKPLIAAINKARIRPVDIDGVGSVDDTDENGDSPYGEEEVENL